VNAFAFDIAYKVLDDDDTAKWSGSSVCLSCFYFWFLDGVCELERREQKDGENIYIEEENVCQLFPW